ncbi:zinc-binding dehydrogenase [Okibacterium endophyticum]
MTTTSRGIVFESAETATLADVALPALQPGQVLVKTIVSVISAGTELTAFTQRFAPGTNWESYARLPFRPGYSSVGRIEAVGSAVDPVGIGQHVLVEAAHASHHILDADGCQFVPPGVDSEHAAWFALAQIAFRGFWNTETRIGGSVVVVGAGPIGQMVVRWASAAGLARIAVVDPVAARLTHALDGGADNVFGSALGDVAAPLHIEGEAIPTTYIDTTGNPHVFADVLRRAPRFGRVVLLGDAGDPREQRLTSDVLFKDLTIVGAFGAQVREGWPNERVRQLFLDLLSTGRFSLDGMISHRFRPEECQEAYELLAHSRESTMGAAFLWE